MNYEVTWVLSEEERGQGSSNLKPGGDDGAAHSEIYGKVSDQQHEVAIVDGREVVKSAGAGGDVASVVYDEKEYDPK